MWDVILNEILKAIIIQVIMYILANCCKIIIDKISLSKADFNLNGKWVDKHLNFENDLVIEFVKIKQIDNEIQIEIKQYKKDTIKKYKGKGIISGRVLTLYYFDTDKKSLQTGILILGIKDDGKGYSWLEGEYVEYIDTEIEAQKRNTYKLRRINLKLTEKIFLLFNKNIYQELDKII